MRGSKENADVVDEKKIIQLSLSKSFFPHQLPRRGRDLAVASLVEPSEPGAEAVVSAHNLVVDLRFLFW